jgi:hypothetical protein
MEHPFGSLAKKEPRSDAELIAFLAVTRISRGLPIGTIQSLPLKQLTPELVYDSLLSEARKYCDWHQDHIERRVASRNKP